MYQNEDLIRFGFSSTRTPDEISRKKGIVRYEANRKIHFKSEIIIKIQSLILGIYFLNSDFSMFVYIKILSS